MSQRTTQRAQDLRTIGRLAIVLVALSCVAILFDMFQPREKFVSSELQFTDPSPAGLHIMPASCASDPTYNHLNLPQTSDGGGYYVNTGVVEGGLTKDFDPSARLDIKYVCVTNNTGSTYFIPATTKAELQTFINLGSSVPNLQVWGQ